MPQKKQRKLGESRSGQKNTLKPNVRTKELLNPIDIVTRIQKGKLKPETLKGDTRDLVIEYLKQHEGLYNYEIARLLKVHRDTIKRRMTIIETRRAVELQEKGFSTWDIAQKVISTTDYVMRKARDTKDFKLYLDAFHKSIDRLQGLGIVFEKPQQVKIKFPVHSEEDERRIISWLRKIELGLLPTASEGKQKGEIIELVQDESDN